MVLRIFNCQLKIEFSFVLMLSVALLTDNGTIAALLLFASLHEGGHLLLLLFFGGRPERITLAFYGVGLRHSSLLKRWQEWLFLLGGIAVNAVFVAANIHREVNGPLLLINALPIYPLDMGRALRLYVPYRFCRVVSCLFLLGMAVSAVLLKNVSLGLIAVYILAFSLKEDLK